jgi:hypothetical protein
MSAGDDEAEIARPPHPPDAVLEQTHAFAGGEATGEDHVAARLRPGDFCRRRRHAVGNHAGRWQPGKERARGRQFRGAQEHDAVTRREQACLGVEPETSPPIAGKLQPRLRMDGARQLRAEAAPHRQREIGQRQRMQMNPVGRIDVGNQIAIRRPMDDDPHVRAERQEIRGLALHGDTDADQTSVDSRP